MALGQWRQNFDFELRRLRVPDRHQTFTHDSPLPPHMGLSKNFAPSLPFLGERGGKKKLWPQFSRKLLGVAPKFFRRLVTLDGPYKNPRTSRDSDLHFGGQTPKSEKSLFSTLTFFRRTDFLDTLHSVRDSVVLDDCRIFEKILTHNFEKRGFEFLGGVALCQSKVLVAPPGGSYLPRILGLSKLL